MANWKQGTLLSPGAKAGTYWDDLKRERRESTTRPVLWEEKEWLTSLRSLSYSLALADLKLCHQRKQLKWVFLTFGYSTQQLTLSSTALGGCRKRSEATDLTGRLGKAASILLVPRSPPLLPPIWLRKKVDNLSLFVLAFPRRGAYTLLVVDVGEATFREVSEPS